MGRRAGSPARCSAANQIRIGSRPRARARRPLDSPRRTRVVQPCPSLRSLNEMLPMASAVIVGRLPKNLTWSRLFADYSAARHNSKPDLRPHIYAACSAAWSEAWSAAWSAARHHSCPGSPSVQLPSSGRAFACQPLGITGEDHWRARRIRRSARRRRERRECGDCASPGPSGASSRRPGALQVATA